MRRLVAVLAVAATSLALMPSAAHAAVPANDGYANAELLAPSGSIVRSNVGATITANEPMPSCCTIDATIWFTWTAPASRRVTFDTWGSDADTVLAVYTGSTQLNSVEEASDDDGMGCDWTSFVQFDAVAGRKYHVQVGTWDASFASANLHLTWNWSRTSFPTNDDVAHATGITPSAPGTSVPGSNAGATSEDSNFVGEQWGESTTWYSMTVASPGVLTLGLANAPGPNAYGRSPDVSAELWDNSDVLPNQLDTVTDGQARAIELDHAGTYYIRMYSPLVCWGAAFTLTEQFAPGALVTSAYTSGDAALLASAAQKLGLTTAQLQHDSVLAWEFIYGLGGQVPTTITSTPAAGPVDITSMWTATEQAQLDYMATGWHLTGATTQQTAALGIAFLALLAG